MTISERTLGYLVAAYIVGLNFSVVVFSFVFIIVERQSSSPPGPGVLFANPFLLAMVAAVLVTALPLFLRWFVKAILRGWKVWSGGEKSHFLSDPLYIGIVGFPSVVVILTTWSNTSRWMPGLTAGIISIAMGVLVYALMLFPFMVLMSKVHERYNRTTLDRLVSIDCQWSWTSFKLFYTRPFNSAYRKLKKPRLADPPPAR
ncbi:MAG: hypothetical protein JRN35_05585 [Nitrososphaerota archaeon]|nr:hypothetical protein [Nitrososphaerota archaeon]